MSTRSRFPVFYPVPVRTRADGWTARKQAEFIGMLAETGPDGGRIRRHGARDRLPVADQAGGRGVRARVGRGVAIAGVRRPRTPRPRKVTHARTWRMLMDGQWQPVLRQGKYAGSVQQPDNSALLGYMEQLDRSFRAMRKDLLSELRSQAETGAPASTPPGPPGGQRG